MNILFFTRRFYPQIGGVETHVLEIGKMLIEMGHFVTVITEYVDHGKVLEEVDGIEIIRIKVGKDDWFKKFRAWNELLGIRKVILNADIAHCHDVFFWYFPFRFLYPWKKVFTTFHGYETKFPPEKKAIVIRKISELLSSGNICIGDYIIKWYRTKPNFVLYGGVRESKNSKINESSYTESMSQNLDQKIKISLFGRLEKDIGVSIYLKALKRLSTEKIKYDFNVFGEGSIRKTLKKYGKVHGFIEEVDNKIARTDVVFCSSYLLMLQALIQKKVVIAVYDNPLKEDYLRMSPFANYIYLCKNADEIFDVISIIRKDPWKSSTMLENGYKFAKLQTWKSVTDIYIELWKI